MRSKNPTIPLRTGPKAISMLERVGGFWSAFGQVRATLVMFCLVNLGHNRHALVELLVAGGENDANP